jgi:hypothetical protein
VVVSLLVPSAIVFVAWLAGKLAGSRVRGAILAVTFALIIGLFCWQQIETSAPLLRYTVPLVVTVLVTWLLMRSAFVRNFALCLGLAVPVVIVAFLVRYPVWSEAGPHEKGTEVAAIEKDVPVVMVIFDELPLAALEDDRGRIDRRLFPNFAALADTANWYPDMLTPSTTTVSAVPAIMTGRPPTSEFREKVPPPGLSEYPDSLCRMAESGGYGLNSYEPITDLCRRNFGLGGRITAAIKRGVGAVEQTANTNLAPGNLAPRVANRLADAFEQPWPEYGAERELAIDRFVDGLSPDKRSFNLLHIALPHIFWQFMPDGSQYDSNRFIGAESLDSPPSRAQIGHDMQQMMLQLVYTDRQLGRIIDRMKEQGTWESALFIATADHGAGFIPGGERRILDDANSGWLLPVPLFVKFPGQEKGSVVNGEVDSLDITPTVLDVLGIEPPEGLPGQSLAEPPPSKFDPVVSSHGAYGPTEIDRAQVNRLHRAAVRMRNRFFGDGRLFALAGHAGLLGRNPEKVKGFRPLEAVADDPAAFADVNPDSGHVPSYFRATIEAPGKPGRKVAVALNGRIVATTTTWKDEDSGDEVTGVNLPSGRFVPGANLVAVYELPR